MFRELYERTRCGGSAMALALTVFAGIAVVAGIGWALYTFMPPVGWFILIAAVAIRYPLYWLVLGMASLASWLLGGGLRKYREGRPERQENRRRARERKLFYEEEKAAYRRAYPAPPFRKALKEGLKELGEALWWGICQLPSVPGRLLRSPQARKVLLVVALHVASLVAAIQAGKLWLPAVVVQVYGMAFPSSGNAAPEGGDLYVLILSITVLLPVFVATVWSDIDKRPIPTHGERLAASLAVAHIPLWGLLLGAALGWQAALAGWVGGVILMVAILGFVYQCGEKSFFSLFRHA